ncbi:hypothetical protein FEDK69T_24630 [Flavobacterium enshiense DK69]|nr:hypothetical protein FEDK69T_24630 [Flavobacterium enshiense DK69]
MSVTTAGALGTQAPLTFGNCKGPASAQKGSAPEQTEFAGPAVSPPGVALHEIVAAHPPFWTPESDSNLIVIHPDG